MSKLSKRRDADAIVLRLQGKSSVQRLLDLIEQPLFLAVVGILGSIVGAFYTPVLIVCEIAILMALHRSKAVQDKSRTVQTIAYVALFAASAPMVYGSAWLIKKNLSETIQTIADGVAKRINASASPATTSSPVQPLPTPSPTAPIRLSDHKPIIKPTAKPQITPTIVIPLPATGNIKERAVKLSNEIMEMMYRNGWGLHSDQPTPPGVTRMPNNLEGNNKWVADRSHYFKSVYLEKVVAMRNELAQFHLQDESMDNDLRFIYEYPNQSVNPTEIESIANSLKGLAMRIKSE